MKHKVFIRALIISLLAFLLYAANWRRAQDTELKIIEPKTTQTAKKKQQKEPKLKNFQSSKVKKTKPTESGNVTVDKGSLKSLSKQIKKVMGTESAYQVAVQDLNNSAKYARVANTNKAHNVNGTMRLFLLVAVYKQEQRGKLHPRTSIKIKKADRVKGERMLQTNMAYGIAYLRQAMMRGNKTAANALLRKVGKANVNQVAKQFGASQTVLLNKFNKSPVGKTTANNLDVTLKGLYQGRVLNRQNAYIVMGAMHGHKMPLTSKISGASYGVGDAHSAAAIVQSGGHSYCISVWSNSNKNFVKLGNTVETWFKKHH